MELIDILKKVAELRGTSLEHEIAKHNIRIAEERLEMAANRKPLPCANEEERVARRKAARKRGRQASRQNLVVAR